jgi:hypothetical protein
MVETAADKIGTGATRTIMATASSQIKSADRTPATAAASST